MLTSTSATASTAGVGEVDFDAPAVKFLLIQARNGGLSLLGRTEGHEAEPTGATSVTIPHNDGLDENQSTYSYAEQRRGQCSQRHQGKR